MPEGFRLGRYQLHQKLAVGGMAEIWLASQSGPKGFSKQLVIKRILPHLTADAAFVEMFLNEGRIAAMINHPNVVQVFELGEEAGSYYLVMEHVPGWSLRHVLSRLAQLGQPAPLGCLAQLMVGACRGLHAAHELTDASGAALGIVHRDVSPENILISRSGEAKVTDFGIAKAASVAGTTRPGETKGKLAYMSPEQLLGRPLDRRADVYAAGATLYELIAGRRPFVVPADAALSLEILKVAPAPLTTFRPDLPAPVAQLVNRALEKDAAARWPDALQLARALEPFAESASAVADWLSRVMPALAEGPLATPVPATAAMARASTSSMATTELAPPAAEPVVSAAPARRWWFAAGGIAVLGFAMLGAMRFFSGDVVAPAVPVPAPAPVSAPPPSPTAESAPGSTRPDPGPTKPAETPSPAPTEVSAEPGTPPATVRKPKAGKGKLLVRVSPWADVLVDGKMVGATPLAPLELTAGRHSVTITNGELGRTRNVIVEIKAGRQELVEVNLQK